jgi:4-hydroxythreonine-4-phosphate dehydrogenase
MGDPAGVGPEIIVKSLASYNPKAKKVIPIVVGNVEALQYYTRLLKIDFEITSIDVNSIPASPTNNNRIFVIEPRGADIPSMDKCMGKIDTATGRASFTYVAEAIKLSLAGMAAGIVTAPISKTAWHLAGIDFPGHTEMLAHYGGSDNFAMMMVAERLKVVLATIHIPLRSVIESLNPNGLLRLFKLVHESMPLFGIKESPRIGVCGINPHAGEDGLLGSEEREMLVPVMDKGRDAGFNLLGPYPADTIFHRMREGDFDVVIAMYHDQALIPIKTLDFHGGVNVTLGLPFIRTSVDHGTAFPIAGKGIARPESILHALDLAAEMTRRKANLARKDTSHA